MNAGRVAVIGGLLVDVRAKTRAAWLPNRSLPGTISLQPGGCAGNVAADLAKLGHDVRLLSVVGDDPLGDWLLDSTRRAGVDVTGVSRRRGVATGCFVSVAREGEGLPRWCVADACLVETPTPHELASWRATIEDADLVVCDANPSVEAGFAVAGMAGRRPRVLLATSPDKAHRVRPRLRGALMLVCNEEEAAAAAGGPAGEGSEGLGAALLAAGVAQVVVTRAEKGLAVIRGEGTAYAAAEAAEAVDPTGAGDAVAAASVHAHLAGFSLEETAAFAAAAAAIVVRSERNSPEGLRLLLNRR